MEESDPSGSVCCFCLTSHDDEALYGKFYKIEEITTHYFCLLLSSKIQQRGSDDEGILGFLPKDIRNEVRRGKTLMCAYCKKRGATITCHSTKCRLHFHLPCGRAKDTFHQFFGEFKSFCCRHRKSQSIKKEVLKAMTGRQSTCSICLESVPATPSPRTLWAPCCSKEAWFHRLCVQRLALSAGYFFKCPLCNNTNRFVEAMRSCGIWIPEQDASWERDTDRYDALLQRHNSCDAKSCRCRQGRTFHLENTKWEIMLCADCGSQGMHVHCGNLRLSQEWVCAICANVISSKKQVAKTGKVSLARARNRGRRRLPTRPERRMTRLQQLQSTEEEEDVDVEKDENSENNKTARADVTSPGLNKGAFSGSRKRAAPGLPKGSPTSPLKQSEPRELIPETVQSAPNKEDSDVEIIDVGDNSDDEDDDEVQHWRSKKVEPLVCTCKRNRRNRWPWDVRRPISSSVSSCCDNWNKKYFHHGKSCTSPIKDSENSLLSRFFSTLASCQEKALLNGEPRCHHLWVIHQYQVGCSSKRSPCSSGTSGLETSSVRDSFSSGSRPAKSPTRSQCSQKRSLSSSREDGTSLKMSPRKNLKLSPNSKVKAGGSRLCCNLRKDDNSYHTMENSLNNSPLSRNRIPSFRKQHEKQTFSQKNSSQRSKSETRSIFRLRSESETEYLQRMEAPQTNSMMQTRSFRRASESSEFQYIVHEIDSRRKSRARKITSPKRSLTRDSISKQKAEQATYQSSNQFLCNKEDNPCIPKGKACASCTNSNSTSSISENNMQSLRPATRYSTRRRSCCGENSLQKKTRYSNDLKEKNSYQTSSLSPERRVKKLGKNTVSSENGDSRCSSSGLSKRKGRPRKRKCSFRTESELKLSHTKDVCSSSNGKDTEVGNGLELAESSFFQPIVRLERMVFRRDRSKSVERPAEREIRLQGGRSRREQFLMKNKQRGAKRAACRSPKDFQMRSPIRTRSRSRDQNLQLPLQAGETPNTCFSEVTADLLHPENKEFPESILTFEALAPTEMNKEYVLTRTYPDSPDSNTTPESDETVYEVIVDKDRIKDAIASMSDDSFSVNDETDFECDVEEDLFNDKIEELSFCEKDDDYSSDSDVSSIWSRLSRSSSPHFSSISPFSFSASHIPVSKTFHPSLSLETASLSFSAPSPSTPPSSSHSLQVNVPSFSNMVPQSSKSSDSSCQPSLLPADMLSNTSVGSSESSNQISCKPQQNLSSQPISSSLESSSEPLQSLSADHPPCSPPSPRRSPRSHSPVPSYNYRAVKKALVDTNNPLCVRRSSPPPIFPKRSGTPTEMECRMKARALTARKFVPMSQVATEQRELVRQMQVSREKH